MKKLYILFIVIVISFLLCACTNIPKDITDTASDTGTTDPLVDTAYENIERRQAIAYKTNTYGFSNDSVLLTIAYPNEWIICEADGGFDILRADMVVGCLTGSSAKNTDDWVVLDTEECSQRGVSVTKHIERNGAAGATEYRYRYVYTYSSDGETRTVTLTVALAELDQRSEEKLFTSAFPQKKATSDTAGVLSDALGDESSILILGNSFIGTSHIGNILREMFGINGKDCTVTAIARGFARVATYISDTALLESIRGGTYDAVFICGFYDAIEVENLGVLKSACDESFTELIIFPAHNENATHVATARDTYPSLVCLNWKGELDGLIAEGVDRWDLCIDDAHYHSTPLAGYVGAHMIYRAIYDELPEEPMRSTLSQSYIDHILGDYAYVGDTQSIDENKITYLD